MSKRINVNPDHYKTAGRERQGANVLSEVEKQRLATERALRRRRRRKAHTGVAPPGKV
jgi:hypothetical protein